MGERYDELDDETLVLRELYDRKRRTKRGWRGERARGVVRVMVLN